MASVKRLRAAAHDLDGRSAASAGLGAAYLTQPFITSTYFKLEPNGSKWNPTPCKIDPPSLTYGVQ